MAKIFTKLNIGDAVASSGTRVFKKLTTFYSPPEEIPSDCLMFSSTSAFTLETENAQKNWDGVLEYSTDTKKWNEWDGTTISADSGVLYVRGTGNTRIAGIYGNDGWVLDGVNISCEGNIENILDYTTVASGKHPTMAKYCYRGMFAYCTSLTKAPELPATTLAEYCYCNMFADCTSLTKAPELPATTLAKYCYTNMFDGCTSLTTATALPATTLAEFCYRDMFRGCTRLNVIPKLPASILPDYCYCDMFKNCKAIKLSSTKTGEYQTAYGIYASWEASFYSLYGMFSNTGGTFTSSPSRNTTYYTSNEVV